ncbi:MAG TPA: endonuclease III [Candidatus Eisenbacteria bacterium]|nr:endonuclease III [Candidatus Eisenbacteria bacterium]
MIRAGKGESAASRRRRLKSVIALLEKVHPDARLDLDFKTPLELLIALILAAQARDDLVNEVTADLFRKYPSAADYARAPLSELERALGRLNFYRNKSRAVQKCCSELVRRFEGRVPDRLDDLLTLPGVGRKTANILLGNAFHRPAIGVDTHVMRLAQRLGFTEQSDPDKIEADLAALVPDRHKVRFCHLLQYHGRRICLAKAPQCPRCVIRSLCPYPFKTQLRAAESSAGGKAKRATKLPGRAK